MRVRIISSIVSLILSGTAYSQNSVDFNKIDANNVSAKFSACGLFSNYWIRNFAVPGSDSLFALAAGSWWFSGIDSFGQLRVAGQMFQCGDFWTGPLDSSGNTDTTTSKNWNHVWKVTKIQIDSLLADYLDNGTINNVPSASLLSWPAKGNPFATGNNGASIVVNNDAAPFFDRNHDDNYNAYDGDFPVVKLDTLLLIPDQILWFVSNDQLHNHASGGMPLGLEIQTTVYAFGDSVDTLMNDAIFTLHKIKNKGSNSFSSFYAALFIDFESPCFGYVGCDTVGNSFFAYRDNPIACSQSAGINYSPYQVVTFLNGLEDASQNDVGLTYFKYFNNDFTNNGNPSNAFDYDELLTGRWKDGSQQSCGGSGIGGIDTCNFIFPDNPSILGGWSECALNDLQSDKRALATTGSVPLMKGNEQEINLAFVMAKSPSVFPCSNYPDSIPSQIQISLHNKHVDEGTLGTSVDDVIFQSTLKPEFGIRNK